AMSACHEHARRGRAAAARQPGRRARPRSHPVRAAIGNVRSFQARRDGPEVRVDPARLEGFLGAT
ncbi:hypothetical protein AB1399_01250, partial [Hydrogenibacillus schlegelii]|uniref:hypothetical protein n=1 Tax=Hydrogenibacillus schlegelii TaxID=1484 RepID=UPI0034A0A201